MSILSKGQAIKKIRIVKRKHRDGTERFLYEANLGKDYCGNTIRFHRKEKQDLIDLLEEFYDEFYGHGNIPVKKIDKHLYYEAERAAEILKQHGITTSLLEVVRQHIEEKGRLVNKPLGDAFEEYLSTIQDYQKRHRDTILCRVRPWVTWVGRDIFVHQLTKDDLSIYLERHPEWATTTQNNVISEIKTFIQWCAHPLRVYISSNPFNVFKKQRIPYKEPEFLSVTNVRRLFNFMFTKSDDIELLWFLTLWFFCGIRVAELERMEKLDINMTDKTIRVKQPKGWTQGRPPRLIDIPENAFNILTKFDLERELPRNRLFKNIEGIKTRINIICETLEIEIPNNAGRHSFITHHIAAFKNPAMTELMCGTSSQMRVHHYQGLVSQKEGEEYFKIGL